MDLLVDILTADRVQRIKITGEIDVYTAEDLRKHLNSVKKEQGIHAELDISEVAYMDSTGLGVFVEFYKVVESIGGHVKITGVNTRLKRLFEITGLDKIMDIELKERRNSDATI